jgi:hypothetical protein
VAVIDAQGDTIATCPGVDAEKNAQSIASALNKADRLEGLSEVVRRAAGEFGSNSPAGEALLGAVLKVEQDRC